MAPKFALFTKRSKLPLNKGFKNMFELLQYCTQPSTYPLERHIPARYSHCQKQSESVIKLCETDSGLMESVHRDRRTKSHYAASQSTPWLGQGASLMSTWWLGFGLFTNESRFNLSRTDGRTSTGGEMNVIVTWRLCCRKRLLRWWISNDLGVTSHFSKEHRSGLLTVILTRNLNSRASCDAIFLGKWFLCQTMLRATLRNSIWYARPPDLISIEHVWDLLEKRLRNVGNPS